MPRTFCKSIPPPNRPPRTPPKATSPAPTELGAEGMPVSPTVAGAATGACVGSVVLKPVPAVVGCAAAIAVRGSLRRVGVPPANIVGSLEKRC